MLCFSDQISQGKRAYKNPIVARWCEEQIGGLAVYDILPEILEDSTQLKEKTAYPKFAMWSEYLFVECAWPGTVPTWGVPLIVIFMGHQKPGVMGRVIAFTRSTWRCFIIKCYQVNQLPSTKTLLHKLQRWITTAFLTSNLPVYFQLICYAF